MQRVKVGVIFGGPSREREISFAGGRTVYDNLDKSIFEAVPIFVDSFKQFILLDWHFIYKGSIRDFYPPVSKLEGYSDKYQIYAESLGDLTQDEQKELGNSIGKVIALEDLKSYFDVAFLTLHGEFGEDGQIQGIFDSLEIPYTGSGVLPSAIGIDKTIQKKWMKMAGFPSPKSLDIRREAWSSKESVASYLEEIKEQIGDHFVIRPAHQGSSIGVSILNKPSVDDLEKAIDDAFFETKISRKQWQEWNKEEQELWIRTTCDIRDGLGLPIFLSDKKIYNPSQLAESLNEQFATKEVVHLKAIQSEEKVLVEDFLNGQEFSCIVLRTEQGTSLALPPTEIVKGGEVFDYRSKYLPGYSRKLTPINLDLEHIKNIQNECVKLFELFGFHTYARIDGFFQSDGTVYLNDPNTTSGMLPSSFFFHQAAELGLNPSQLISFIIRQSVYERMRSSQNSDLHLELLKRIDLGLSTNKKEKVKKKIGVILGGYSFERHISVESGRNIFEKLSSSEKYEAVPIFLRKEDQGFTLHQLPINLLLKDNSDDIRDKVSNFKKHPLIEELRIEGADILDKYINQSAVLVPEEIKLDDLKDRVDGVFIALHGRPGEDGEIQKFLEKEGIPYNGSGPDSSRITIHKYNTLQLLKEHGFIVTNQSLLNKSDYIRDAESCVAAVEGAFDYPFIVKPVDDGCSSAVMVIKNKEQFINYIKAIFREEDAIEDRMRSDLGLEINEEFPVKDQILVENKIASEGAKYFLEVTGGLLTKYEGAELVYEIFEPSEALAGEGILSLEEKFLAGEGQNITPARFGKTAEEYDWIASQVKKDFEKAARILNVEGYARIDAFVRVYDDRVETIIIEVNSLPGMTPATCIFHQTALNGYKPFEFIDNILTFAFEKG